MNSTKLRICSEMLGVFGTIDGKEVDTGHNGWSLTSENGENVPITKDSKIELSVSLDF